MKLPDIKTLLTSSFSRSGILLFRVFPRSQRLSISWIHINQKYQKACFHKKACLLVLLQLFHIFIFRL